MAILEDFEETKMTVKIALLGFGTVASGVPFLLKENGEKIVQSAHSEGPRRTTTCPFSKWRLISRRAW